MIRPRHFSDRQITLHFSWTASAPQTGQRIRLESDGAIVSAAVSVDGSGLWLICSLLAPFQDLLLLAHLEDGAMRENSAKRRKRVDDAISPKDRAWVDD